MTTTSLKESIKDHAFQFIQVAKHELMDSIPESERRPPIFPDDDDRWLQVTLAPVTVITGDLYLPPVLNALEAYASFNNRFTLDLPMDVYEVLDINETVHDGFFTMHNAGATLHHSKHREMWRTILRYAERARNQVLVSSQSWDCFVGLAEAAREIDFRDYLVQRIDAIKHEDDGRWRFRCMDYNPDDLEVCIRQHIEFR